MSRRPPEVGGFEPARKAIRAALAVFGLTFSAFLITVRLGFLTDRPGLTLGCGVASGVALLAAAVKLPFVVRAAVAVFLGTAPLALGARGEGPLAAMSANGALVACAGVAVSTVLPAALFFRARYRDFTSARIILGFALAASAPALFFWSMQAAQADAALVTRVVDGFAVASALTALFGFLGEETSAGCTQWATLIVIVHAVRIAVPAIGTDPSQAIRAGLSLDLLVKTPSPGALFSAGEFLIAAAGDFVGSLVVALGLLQLATALLVTRTKQLKQLPT